MSIRLPRMLATLLAGYVVFAALVALMQRRMLYIPTRLEAGTAEELAARAGFEAWRTAGGELIGWRMPASGEALGSVLVLHGNAGCALDRGYLAQPIHAAGPYDVHVLEYPGFGARGGSPSLSSLLAAAEEAFDALPARHAAHLVGESLGSGPAAHLAKVRGQRVRGLTLFAPYDDLARVGQAALPFLPVALLLRDRFRPSRWLEGVRAPLLAVLAERDEVVPVRLGRSLFERYGGPKRLQVLPGARHNDIAGQSASWWGEALGDWPR
jgi:pimeloyl-ACP methyl ester carboxylesterase